MSPTMLMIKWLLNLTVYERETGSAAMRSLLSSSLGIDFFICKNRLYESFLMCYA